MIGLIVADITNPSDFDIIRGAQSAAAKRGFTLVLAGDVRISLHRGHGCQAHAILNRRHHSGHPRLSDQEICALGQTRPVAAINRSVDGTDSVVPDVGPGISETVRHLASNAHHKVAFLPGSALSWMSSDAGKPSAQPVNGQARKRTSLPPRHPTSAGGRLAARDVIASGATAALCYKRHTGHRAHAGTPDSRSEDTGGLQRRRLRQHLRFGLHHAGTHYYRFFL
jgi:DNA-binding LacI/PurR family transcriptional regulator